MRDAQIGLTRRQSQHAGLGPFCFSKVAGRVWLSLDVGQRRFMSTERSFTIEARIDHLSEGVGCFDPIQVVQRLRGAFPEIIEPSRDYLGQTYEDLRKID